MDAIINVLEARCFVNSFSLLSVLILGLYVLNLFFSQFPSFPVLFTYTVDYRGFISPG